MTSLLDRALEGSLLGYTKLGARLRELPAVTDDLRGRRIVITGASSGLGKHTAGALAALGADLTLVGRNRSKTEAVADELRGDGMTDIEIADLSLMEDTRRLAGRLSSDGRPVHVLINNAGVLLPRRQVTTEGIETTLATNLLSHFVLTNGLLPKMRSSADDGGARVINVSSGGMYTQRIRVNDLEFKQGRYDGAVAYARTKRGQVILTGMWAEQLRGSGVVVHSMHPGWADTPGVQRSLPTFRKLTHRILRDAAMGADTVIWLAATNDPAARESGRFWHDRRTWPTHRMRATRETREERLKLWERLEALGS